MFVKHNGFIPNDPSNENYLYNPNGTMPYPAPSSMPVAFWDGGVASLLPTTATNPEYWREAKWRSPLFDLRPDLRNMTGGDSKGVAIWGIGKLYTLVNNLRLTARATEGLKVTIREFASPNRADLIFQVTDPIDVSESFVTVEKPATTLEFYPLNSGSPIRFWQVEILFEWTIVLPATPRFSIFSSYY